MLAPYKVGYKLGMHFDWLHHAPVRAMSLLILQIWSQNTNPQQIFAMYRMWFFPPLTYMLRLDQFLKQDLQIAADLENEKKEQTF